MNPAAVAYACTPVSEPTRITVSLTPDEQAALASAALAMTVSYFAAADRAEFSGDLDRADALRFTALSLTQAELKIRRS